MHRRMLGLVQPARIVTPGGGQALDDPLHRLHIVVGRAEVPALGKPGAVFEQGLGQAQIAVQRLQHMLPGPGRLRISHYHRQAGVEGTQGVGHQPVGRPIAAADHVAGASGADRDARLGQERRAVGRGHQFRTGLAAAVRVVAAHRLVFTVAPDPFAVLVALVGGDIDDGAHAAGRAGSFEHVHRAHHVGGVGGHRRAVRQAHQRLRRQVQHDLRLAALHGAAHGVEIADVAQGRLQAVGHPRLVEQAGRGGRCQRQALHLGAQRLQPQGQPTALEAGVTGEEDALAVPEVWGHGHGNRAWTAGAATSPAPCSGAPRTYDPV